MSPAYPLSTQLHSLAVLTGKYVLYLGWHPSPFTKSPAPLSNGFTFFLFILLLLSSTEACIIFLGLPHKYQLHLNTAFLKPCLHTQSFYIPPSSPFLLSTFWALPFALPSHPMAMPGLGSPRCAWQETGQQGGPREKEWIGQEARNSKNKKEILCALYSGYPTSYSGAWFPELLSIPAASELNRTWTLL